MYAPPVYRKQWFRKVRRRIVLGVPPTYTGSSSVTVGAATLSSSATFVPPTYTGAGAVTTGAVTVASSATFTSPAGMVPYRSRSKSKVLVPTYLRM